MYTTRLLSQLQKSPDIVAAPPDGPNSGYLVIQDEESETHSCFGLFKNRTLDKLPFPQNKELTVEYWESIGKGGVHTYYHPLFLIPVLNQPLSSNRYYAIDRQGKHTGEAFTCSREADKATCCFFRCVDDVNPRPLDPHDIYQQFEIAPHQGLCSTKDTFIAETIAPDGYPPYFLRRRDGWTIDTNTPRHFKLDIAQGLNSKLRARLPDFDFPLSRKSSEPFVVGKWYCPFVFVKEGTLRYQVEKSMYYELTLEQRWEQIFTCCNNTNDNRVAIDTMLEKEEVFVYGSKAMWSEEKAVDGVIWFTSYGLKREETRVGLRVEIVEIMKWEQARGGWIGGEKRRAKINRVEELKEGGEWSKFGLYVLVERFNLRRMDGSLVMFYDFKHFHQMKTKWE